MALLLPKANDFAEEIIFLILIASGPAVLLTDLYSGYLYHDLHGVRYSAILALIVLLQPELAKLHRWKATAS